MCGICGKLDRNSLCSKCKIKLENLAVFQIEDYSKTTSFFDEHIYMFQYSGEIRNAILNYKFRDKPYIYETFVNFLKNNKKVCVKLKKYDIIVPIPISKKRLKQRGYNQSAIFAKRIAKDNNIQYNNNLLKKGKDNKPQSDLNKEQRIKNVEDVYKINQRNSIFGKKILLVDDIFTTGNTVNEASKILRQAGAKRIGVFTLAKD